MSILPRSCGIYVITCTLNGKIYIGSSVNMGVRQNEHLSSLKKGTHRNPHLQNAYNKYGVDAFVFEIVELCERGKQLDREQYYLDTLQPYQVGIGYNIGRKAEAAQFGREVPIERRERLSKSIKAYYATPEGFANKSAAMMGHIVKPETREKISAKQRGIKKPPEQIEKMRIAFTGREVSVETRAKMSASQMGKKMSPEAIAKTVAGKEKLFIVTAPDGTEYLIKGLAQFCREHGLNRGNMMSVIVGKRSHNHGWKCRYA